MRYTQERMPDWERANAADWADVLSTFPLFAGVRKRELRKLAQQATFAEFAPGEHIPGYRESADALYVILGGAAKTQKPTPRELRTGDYFGELTVIDESSRPASFVATQALDVMRLPRQAVRRLAQANAAVSMAMLRNLIPQLRRVEMQVAASS